MRCTIHGGGPGRAGWRSWAAILVLALWASTAAAADQTITLYQWTDSNGVTRYTPDFDRIPINARGTAVAIQPGADPPPKTPVYFEPDPREPAVAVPGPPPEGATRSASPSTSAPAPSPGTSQEQRVQELEALIAQDEEALKQLISEPGAQADVTVSPELREIAARLPRLQAELASLRQQATGSNGP